MLHGTCHVKVTCEMWFPYPHGQFIFLGSKLYSLKNNRMKRGASLQHRFLNFLGGHATYPYALCVSMHEEE